MSFNVIFLKKTSFVAIKCVIIIAALVMPRDMNYTVTGNSVDAVTPTIIDCAYFVLYL